jgi:DNA-binding NtrC family response regulator
MINGRWNNNMVERIMIVDDEEDVLISLKTILKRQNFDVITVSNGRECLKELKKGFRGIILMDLMMPTMDGWETINEIVKRGYIDDVAISVITGKGTKDYQKMSLLGSYVFDYLSKPIDTERLISSVEKSKEYFYSRNN